MAGAAKASLPEELLSCAVCRDAFTTGGLKAPYVLAGCGHSFCRPCLTSTQAADLRVSSAGTSGLRCPLCRKTSSKALRNHSLVAVRAGLGVPRDHIRVVEPTRHKKDHTVATIQQELAYEGVSVIIARRACVTYAKEIKALKTARSGDIAVVAE